METIEPDNSRACGPRPCKQARDRSKALHAIPSYSKRLCLPIDPARALLGAFAQLHFTIKS
jgi:hypothetical protein